MEYNVKLNLDAETSKAEQKINDFASKTEKLRGIADEPAQPVSFEQSENTNITQIKQQADNQLIEKINISNESLSNFIDNFKLLNDLMPTFSEKIRSISKSADSSIIVRNESDKKDDEKSLDKWTKKIKDMGIISLLTTGIAAGFEYDASRTRRRTRALDADIFGIEHERIQGNGNVAKALVSGGSVVIGGVVSALATPAAGLAVGSVINTVGNSVISGVTGSKDAKVSENERQAQIYQQKFPSLEKSLVYYSEPKQTAIENRREMEFLNRFWTEKSLGTGLSTEEFINFANSLSEYGVKSKEQAGNIVHEAGVMAKYTGTDGNLLVDFMGNRARLGSKDSQKDLQRAFVYSQEAGLAKGQFGEFLDGLQSAVEQGIAKGYITSTEDVSRQMMMFSKLSGGNEAWEGKYGFQKLSQINNGLASATALGSSSQIIAYQALHGIVSDDIRDEKGNIIKKGIKGGAFIKGQDALNALSLMESGLNPASFKAIAGTMNNVYGNDVMSQVAAWKELTGLNYTGAMQLYEMANNGELDNLSKEEIQRKINDLTKNKEFQTDSKKIADSVNKIQADVHTLSEKGFKIYKEELQKLEQNTAKDAEIYDKANNPTRKTNKINYESKNQKDEFPIHNLDFIQKFLNENFEMDIDGSRGKRALMDIRNVLKQSSLSTSATIYEKNLSNTYKETFNDGEVSQSEIKELVTAMNEYIRYVKQKELYLNVQEKVIVHEK